MRQKRESNFSNLIDTLKEYINLKIEYGVLSITERISVLAGKVAYVALMAIFSLVILLLLTILIYNVLMAWIGIPWLVALIEIGFILLIMGIIAIFRHSLIINPIADSIIRNILDYDKEEEEEEDEI